MTPCILVDT